MLDKKISVSEQVANLSVDARLLFTWSIPHADDVGLLPYGHKTLAALIFPMVRCTDAEFSGWVDEIVRQDLWREFEWKDPTGSKVERFYQLVKFTGHQTLKRDRQPQVIIPSLKISKDPKKTWLTLQKVLEDCGFHLETSGNQLDTEEKRSEEKRSEENTDGPANSIKYLSNLPDEDLKEFTERFIADAGGVRSKAEDLKLYCERTGKKYKNYKSFLLNALKRDFKERTAKEGKYGKLS